LLAKVRARIRKAALDARASCGSRPASSCCGARERVFAHFASTENEQHFRLAAT
jgi:hypothetical protein